jgi:DMSO/TMAO reductase YedYZ heme-binding membrane subunit
MNPQIWWYLARATGYVAWALVATSVVSGLLLTTRLTNGRPRPAWTADLHRFLAGTAVAFTGLHLAGLVADNYVHFDAADLLVPFASSWRTGAVALGVVAMYLLVAVEVSSLLMRRLPKRIWRGIHLTSYLAFWLGTFHLITAGTDASHPLSTVTTTLVIAVVVFLTLVRALSGRGARRRHQAAPTATMVATNGGGPLHEHDPTASAPPRHRTPSRTPRRVAPGGGTRRQ